MYIFENLGIPNKSMISFVEQDHMTIFDDEQASLMKHFAATLFGYHLQERDDYTEYFSEDSVAQYDDLAWGVVLGK